MIEKYYLYLHMNCILINEKSGRQIVSFELWIWILEIHSL